MNFRIVADMFSQETMDAGWPTVRDRPVVTQPDPSTDGQDPATPGGPAPMNGTGPYSEPVTSDPLLPVPRYDKGGPIPHVQGPDVDTTTLKSFRERG